MQPVVKQLDPSAEFYTEEGCFIIEVSNSADDPGLSVARARVPAGRTTRWHRLRGTVERYVILEGAGLVEVEGMPGARVLPGDVILIPSGASQRITSTGSSDLVFLALCTPRFEPEVYEDTEEGCQGAVRRPVEGSPAGGPAGGG